MEAITAAPFAAGLSNQKLALTALMVSARREGRAVALPALLDFDPEAPRHATRDYGEIFDLAVFEAEAGVLLAPTAGESRDPESLFHGLMAEIGAAQDKGVLARHPALGLLASMRPEPGLQALVDEARRRFHEAGGYVICQMRIERDWAVYIDTRLAYRLGATQDLGINPIAIARKLVNRFGSDVGPVLVTCDLKGLAITKDALADAVASATGLTLLFKQDLIDAILPDTPLAASLIDFELMAGADHMVGTTLSSFFGAASLTHFARNGRSANAWCYNAPGPALLQRTDNGAFANLQRAVGLPVA